MRQLATPMVAALLGCSLLNSYETVPEAGLSGGGSGTGGGGGMPPCTTAGECPGLDTACKQRSCTEGKCAVVLSPPGTRCTEPEPGRCEEGLCVPLPASCGNGVQDGGETDVDCGGACSGCGKGKNCEAPGDCASVFCNAGKCDACTSHVQCPPIGYCGALGACMLKLQNGSGCGDKALAGLDANAVCQSAFCTEGVCCNAGCDSPCTSCAFPMSAGICMPLPPGSPSKEGACGLYLCNGREECPSACAGNEACTQKAYCSNAMTCALKKQHGAQCAEATECASNFCVDGHCCVTSCADACKACSGAKTGNLDGDCAAVKANTNPDGDCGSGDCCFNGMCAPCL